MSVKRASKEGLILPQFVLPLQRAEQAVSGYLDTISGKTISLYEAIRFILAIIYTNNYYLPGYGQWKDNITV